MTGKPPTLNIYPISLGCPKNRVDTERLLGSLRRRQSGLPGARVVKRLKNAHLVLINTCAFISPAIRESARVILENARCIAALPAPERPLLAVAGCLPGRFGRSVLAKDLPEVDLWLETKDLPSWPALILEALAGTPETASLAAALGCGPGRILSTGPSYAWLKISEGCGQACSFCTIPLIRGQLRSSGADELEAEARLLLEQGVKEIILVAQDLTAWGRDLDKAPGLVHLLERLLSLPGMARLRLMYLYPAGIDDKLLSFIRSAGPVLLPYFDVPLQHAHPDVLARMGRPFSRNPHKTVERIRAFLPEAALRTSLIAGFPGESEEQFETLCSFVRETRFHNLGVFSYCAEEGTPAAALPGQIPERVKDFRRDSLMEIQGEISEELLRECIGQRLEILVDAPHHEWPGLHVGRAWFQAPEVDGVTYVSGEGAAPGALVSAEITESFTYDLNALA